MAKKNELIRANAVDAEVLEGEVISPDSKAKSEDYTGEAKHLADTERKFTNLCDRISAHSKEGRRLMAIGAASAIIMVTTTGEARFIDQFLNALGDETRKNMFRKYFETVGPVTWDKERQVEQPDGTMKKQAGFVLHAKKRASMSRKRGTDKAAFDTALMGKAPWEVVGGEADYKADDFKALLARAIKTAERQRSPDYIAKTKATKEEVEAVDYEGLEDAKKLLAKLTAKGGNVHTGNEARH